MSPKETSTTDSLKKALMRPGTFDEASYYKSEKVQIGGEVAPDEFEDEDDDGEMLDEEE